jgi:hypothetical protein
VLALEPGRRQGDVQGRPVRGGRVIDIIVGLAAGCGFIPASEREWRLDPDGDGAVADEVAP